MELLFSHLNLSGNDASLHLQFVENFHTEIAFTCICVMQLLILLMSLSKYVLIQEGKIAGRAVLIAGQPGTGKTAIAMGKIVLSLIYNNIAFFEKVNIT